MKVRSILSGLALVALCPSTVLAQAVWGPPKGELDLSVTYQWLDADRHLFSNSDLQSNSRAVGTVQSHALVVNGELGLTNHLALSGSLAAVAPRYLGEFAHPGTLDDGSFHSSLQDARVGASYMAIERGLWAVTPFLGYTFPVTDYEVLAHAAAGFGLNVLEVGTSVGRVLLAGGAPRGYVQGAYSYGLVDSPVGDVSLDRSRARLEAGLFRNRWSVYTVVSWQYVHGGVEWSDLGNTGLFGAHDQGAAVREWRYGGGVSCELNNGTTLFLALNDLAWGENTHNAQAITFGVNLAFQAFGGALTFGSQLE